MVIGKEEPKRVPWLPVHDDNTEREPIAPSKPAVPARGPSPFVPQPVEVDAPTADIIAPVVPPPPEEIMPKDGQAPWEAIPAFAHPTVTPPPTADPIQSLGDAAVRRASLSASGAALPLGGVAPSAPSSHSASAPVSHEFPLNTSPYQAAPTPAAPNPDEPNQAETDQAEDADQPARASAFPPVTTASITTAPGFMAATEPTRAQSPPPSSTPELDDDAAPYTPLFGTPEVPDPDGGDSSNGEEPPVQDKPTPWWRSWPFLVVVGLLVMGGIAYGVVTALSGSEPVEVAEPVIVPTPGEPTHEPISIEDPTAFQDALPQMVGLYALTGFESPDVATLDLLERAAEATLLTYQYEDITLSARAIQHFDAETAQRHFDALAQDGTDRTPVQAAGTDVGERVTLPSEEGETIVWRNTSALFFVTGPAQAVEEFFTQFPL